MTLGQDYATRLEALADRVRRLGPDRRAPEQFTESKDGVEQELRAMARQVEIDQVFGPRPASTPDRARLDNSPRTIMDRKGRAVRVESRGPRRQAA